MEPVDRGKEGEKTGCGGERKEMEQGDYVHMRLTSGTVLLEGSTVLVHPKLHEMGHMESRDLIRCVTYYVTVKTLFKISL